MADEEAKVGATTMEFYRNSLPAVPLLVVGFLFGEGVELVRNPPSFCGVQAYNTANSMRSVHAFPCSVTPTQSEQLA